jgi:homoprotocatechuate degradation regulator HpaR
MPGPVVDVSCQDLGNWPEHKPMTQSADRSRASPPEPFTHRNLPLLLLQAREQVIARFRPMLNENGVTEQQWRIVRALLETGPLEPREIVVVCGISSPSLAGVLARMEELGLVARKRLDHDQRRVRVSLTPRSRALVRQMAPRVEQAYLELEQQIGPELVQQMYAVLDQLNARLSAPAAMPDTES